MALLSHVVMKQRPMGMLSSRFRSSTGRILPSSSCRRCAAGRNPSHLHDHRHHHLFRIVPFLLASFSTTSNGISSGNGLPLTSSATRGTNVVPIFFDSTNHLHRDLQYHPEQPERISACIKAITSEFENSSTENIKQQQQQGSEINRRRRRIEILDVAPPSPHGDDGRSTSSTAAASLGPTPVFLTENELGHARDMLLQIHDKDLVLKLQERCRASKQRRIEDGKSPLGHIGYIDADTYLTTESFDLCLRATASWIRAADHALQGSTSDGETSVGDDSTSTVGGIAMALMRPPGHHATRTSSNGFCLYNFAAAAAMHVQTQYPNKRVSILDWDVHYGQGTADIVQHLLPNTRYVSIHQTPAFPYMGERFAILGANKNVMTIPVPPDTTWTCGYKEKFEQALTFIHDPGEWEPDLVIISAGYDALDSDELASVSLSAADFGTMTQRLREHVHAGIMFGLEGGYQLGMMSGGGNLQEAVIATIKPLLDE